MINLPGYNLPDYIGHEGQVSKTESKRTRPAGKQLDP